MKKFVILAGAVCLVAGTAHIAAGTTATAADVQALAAAESNVVTVLHQYQDTAAWKSKFTAAVAAQSADIAKVHADLTPPVTPNAFHLVQKTTASGQGADASISVMNGPSNPVGIEFIVTSTPPQTGVLSWGLTCLEANRLASAHNGGQVTRHFPATTQVHMPVANPTSCIVIADAQLNNSGSVTIRLEEETKP
jgi:hypothetical protein